MCKMFNSKEEYNEHIIKLRLFDKIASYIEQPENLNRLKDRGADLIIRVPVIGGFNDTDKEMGKIVALVSEIKPRKCELLPYHNLGEHKYEVTGVPYMIFETPDEKRIAHLKELLRDF